MDYAKLRYGGGQGLATVTLIGAVITAFLIWCNAMETAEKKYDAERLAKGKIGNAPNPA